MFHVDCNECCIVLLESQAVLFEFKYSRSLPVVSRGEYFYLVGGAHLQLILFSSCRNIQFGVFRAEIFILWCIVQKYWSGIVFVTCYTAITIDYLDLTNVSGMLP